MRQDDVILDIDITTFVSDYWGDSVDLQVDQKSSKKNTSE
jgi:hypothetical protein